ncbi:MAG: GNAT family N-acetyltransferase [Chloroflexi bacterium]|nr:MAG: GNAT family N-acetyltransferase [Chloroflexota bacterium]TME03710.1 MAG: GNAT family N-acetyltransferase [Chloroflexota bacterium]TME41889.1 MAG: GNAT family N-acetyltransferase [Chloroflexota bacterium]TME53554.1 MAG: GNAT family N-acetyltransferase [Chloroflexota bacterium]
MYGPVIQGKVVRLRPPKPEDAAAMVTWFEDLEVTRFIKLRHPPSIDVEKEFLDRMARDPDAIFWVVEHEGRIVGGTSIVQIDWKNGFGTTGTVIGDKAAWGKGMGRELMQLRARYAFTQLPLRKLKSGYLEGNQASARAQKSAGYKEVGRWTADRFIDGKWHDHVLTELLREDWVKGNSPG